ncbi:MAG: guanylate kinase [Bacteroidia bacterium]
MNREQKKLLLFCGPSGSGKTTITQHLIDCISHLGFSVSATTRQKRQGEKDGEHYYFLTNDEFRKKIQNGEFVEWEEVYDDVFYGTLRSEIERIWKCGKHVIFDIDVEGGLNIKNQYPENSLAVFVQPPSLEHLRQRLMERATDHPENIEKRVTKAVHELQYAPRFDYVIINSDKNKTLADAERLVKDFLNIPVHLK